MTQIYFFRLSRISEEGTKLSRRWVQLFFGERDWIESLSRIFKRIMEHETPTWSFGTRVKAGESV
jgi:hypothetical protein